MSFWGKKIKAKLRTVIGENLISTVQKEWLLILINGLLGWHVISTGGINWDYQEENKEDSKPWVCESEVKARNTGSREAVVFSCSPDNLSYFSVCPTYLDLPLVADVAAQNYNPSHWTAFSSYPNSPAWKIFKRVREKHSFENELWIILSKTFLFNAHHQRGGTLPPQNLNAQRK